MVYINHSFKEWCLLCTAMEYQKAFVIWVANRFRGKVAEAITQSSNNISKKVVCIGNQRWTQKAIADIVDQ